MPRRGSAPKHDVLPDPIYKSIVLTKLINQVMLDGKRGTAQKICRLVNKYILEERR